MRKEEISPTARVSRRKSSRSLRVEIVAYLIWSLAAVFPLAPEARAALVISEFMALNDTTVTDEDGDVSDWIELYNSGPAATDLDGWYLTDNDEELTQWRLPAEILAPGAYLLVWASDTDRSVPGAPLHTNFKLSGSGEFLGLVKPDGLTVEHAYAPEFPEGSADVSFGSASDLIGERCFLDPTPGAATL